MKKKLKQQQIEYIKNFLIMNKHKRLTGFYKLLLGLVLLGFLLGVANFFSSGRYNLILREKGYLKKEERLNSNFNLGKNLDAENAMDGKVYLLKDNRVEVQTKSTGIWKTYPIPFKGKEITVTEDRVLILSEKGEV
ncbi:MAG: hypothetical protein ACRC34_01165, partial [Cetobacterium sp.]